MEPCSHRGSDGSMGRALAAGLPPEHIAVLMAARRHRQALAAGLPRAGADQLMAEPAAAVWSASLATALAHPAAAAFDELFVAAMRRELGK